MHSSAAGVSLPLASSVRSTSSLSDVNYTQMIVAAVASSGFDEINHLHHEHVVQSEDDWSVLAVALCLEYPNLPEPMVRRELGLLRVAVKLYAAPDLVSISRLARRQLDHIRGHDDRHASIADR
jgi:hypothetical protein